MSLTKKIYADYSNDVTSAYAASIGFANAHISQAASSIETVLAALALDPEFAKQHLIETLAHLQSAKQSLETGEHLDSIMKQVG